MTGIKNKFTSIHLFTQFSSVNIANGTQSPVLDDGVVHATPSLNLKNILYVLKFSVRLLSISQFIKHHNCSVTFFPSYCVFQDLTTGRRIGSGREREGMYYLDDEVSLAGLVAGQPDPILLWHGRLGHPSLQKLRSVSSVESSFSTLDCVSCEIGKYHRVSFLRRVNNCNTPFPEYVLSCVFRFFDRIFRFVSCIYFVL